MERSKVRRENANRFEVVKVDTVEAPLGAAAVSERGQRLGQAGRANRQPQLPDRVREQPLLAVARPADELDRNTHLSGSSWP